jgi:hypothetical protein
VALPPNSVLVIAVVHLGVAGADNQQHPILQFEAQGLGDPRRPSTPTAWAASSTVAEDTGNSRILPSIPYALK